MLIAAGQGKPSPLWFATRASGLVALVLLTACVVLGILITVRFVSARWPRFLTVGLHRNLSVMVLSFVIVHVITTVADSYTQIKFPDAVIPLISVYRPFWLGLGAVAFDLLLALAVTSLVRMHLGHRMWRLTHWAAYACWPVAVLHGLGTGSDPRTRWVLVLTAACVLIVVWALALRLAVGWPDHAALRVGAAALAIVALLASGEWAQHGPLQPGWARKAGTPPPPGAQPAHGGQQGSPASTTQAKGGQP
ncbi:MAG: ferric reductase-like transmembrane domain-containing protein [Micromonosporaceae bacterium]